MTLSRGQSSGRGRAALSKACPPRVGSLGSGATGSTPVSKTGDPGSSPGSLAQRSSLRPVSAKRAALLGDGARSTFAPPKPGAKPKLKQGTTRRKRPGGPDAAGEWRQQALERVVAEHGRLVDEVTGQNLTAEDQPQIHHPCEVGDLFTRHRALVAFAVYHPANAMVVSKRRHERHHNRCEPIPRTALRPATLAMVAELDRLEVALGVRGAGGWWAARIEADYPEAA